MCWSTTDLFLQNIIKFQNYSASKFLIYRETVQINISERNTFFSIFDDPCYLLQFNCFNQKLEQNVLVAFGNCGKLFTSLHYLCSKIKASYSIIHLIVSCTLCMHVQCKLLNRSLCSATSFKFIYECSVVKYLYIVNVTILQRFIR